MRNSWPVPTTGYVAFSEVIKAQASLGSQSLSLSPSLPFRPFRPFFSRRYTTVSSQRTAFFRMLLKVPAVVKTPKALRSVAVASVRAA